MSREVLEAALPIIGTRRTEEARIMHIRNTLQVGEVEVSTPCLTEKNAATKFDVLGDPYLIRFDKDGNLLPV